MTNEMAAPQRTLPPGYIHLGVAKEIAPILRGFGLDPDPVIREAGLDPCLFDDGSNIIPHAALGRLLTLCVARTDCPHFGLLVGQRATVPQRDHHPSALEEGDLVSVQCRTSPPKPLVEGSALIEVSHPECDQADPLFHDFLLALEL